MGSDWLHDAVMYEVYPQSFADSNGDGIGDLRGVIERLDHIASLGIDTLWFNPCFASPFVDAGYDVSDYLRIAPRYGSNEDMVELVAEAKRRGIRVLLDLVAGHTSIDHPWFKRELHAEGPDPGGDRYVWCKELPVREWSLDVPGTPAWVPSPGPRPGWYLKNFFDEQPALNFGWAHVGEGEPWRDAVDAPGPQRNIQALKDIMAFWLERGVAGFRIDMAFSLVKDDGDMERGQQLTAALWGEIREWLDTAYPDAVIVPEGKEPRTGAPLVFHADFFLVIHAGACQPVRQPLRGRAAVPGAAGAVLRRSWPWEHARLPRRLDRRQEAGPRTARDHLHGRPRFRPAAMRAADRRAARRRADVPAHLGVGALPLLRRRDRDALPPGLPDVEGSICHPAYNRAGCRTPMQWDDGPNAGFSTADPSDSTCPLTPIPHARRSPRKSETPTPRSTWSSDSSPCEGRHPRSAGRATTRVLHDGYPFAYLRGDTHLIVVNPRRDPATFSTGELSGAAPLLASGISVVGDTLTAEGFAYGIFALPGHA